MRKLFIVAVLAAGCASSPPAPSCSDAVMHYYGTGCVFIDGNTGQTVPEAMFISDCQNAAAAAPADCVSKLNDWLTCLDDVQPPPTNADCDCSQAQQALLTCH